MQGLRYAFKNFNNKTCRLVPASVVLMRGFVYKEVAICACTAAKQTGISLKFLLLLDDLLMFYQALGMNLSFNRCDIFVAGGACVSIRYCAAIRTYTVLMILAVIFTICILSITRKTATCRTAEDPGHPD